MEFLSINESFISLTIKACFISVIALLLSVILKKQHASMRSQVWSFAGMMLLAFPLASALLPSWEVPFLSPQKAGAEVITQDLQSFSYLMLIWVSGFSLVLFRLISNLIRLKKLQKQCDPVKNLKWIEIAQQVSRNLKIKRKVTLLESDQISMPMTWGFFKPYVLLPKNSDRWNARRRKMVLLHEFEHIYRKDWLIQILSNLGMAIHWFNPFAWLVSFMIRLEREKACDDAVLRVGASPSDYATTLLLFAKHKKEASSLGLTCALQLITGSQLHSRIQSILNHNVGRKRLSKTIGFVLCMVVLGFVLPIAAAHSPVEKLAVLECFPEEDYVASELNIVITPAKLELGNNGTLIQPTKKLNKKPCQKKCNKTKKGGAHPKGEPEKVSIKA